MDSSAKNGTFLRAVLHNIGVLGVGFAVAFAGTKLDAVFRSRPFKSRLGRGVGLLLLASGFILRTWATTYFYRSRMKVVVLQPQQELVTSGPFGFSRNPLYLGGNVFIFFGASLALGTPMGLILTAMHLPLVNLMVRREEQQLEARFGPEWLAYKGKVRRWL